MLTSTQLQCVDPPADGTGTSTPLVSTTHGPLMAICQDNALTGEEVAWTPNDLDTLRHESVHFIQDCLDGSADMELNPLFDGLRTLTLDSGYREVIAELVCVALRLDWIYRQNGADAKTIRLEHEAFLLARHRVR